MSLFVKPYKLLPLSLALQKVSIIMYSKYTRIYNINCVDNNNYLSKVLEYAKGLYL